jgi:hypothetical protein
MRRVAATIFFHLILVPVLLLQVLLRQWCRTDPQVEFTHPNRPARRVKIFASAPVEVLGHVTVPLQFHVYHPSGYTPQTLFLDEEGFGAGETVEYHVDENLPKFGAPDFDFRCRAELCGVGEDGVDDPTVLSLPLELSIVPFNTDALSKTVNGTVGGSTIAVLRLNVPDG